MHEQPVEAQLPLAQHPPPPRSLLPGYRSHVVVGWWQLAFSRGANGLVFSRAWGKLAVRWSMPLLALDEAPPAEGGSASHAQVGRINVLREQGSGAVSIELSLTSPTGLTFNCTVAV